MPISDPLEYVLDLIASNEDEDLDVEYTLNRLSTTIDATDSTGSDQVRISLDKSFGAFMSHKRNEESIFFEKVNLMNQLLRERITEESAAEMRELAAFGGVPVSVVESLARRIDADDDDLPQSVRQWIDWIFDWLASDEKSKLALLVREIEDIEKITGLGAGSGVTKEALSRIHAGVVGWVSGMNFAQIEGVLKPDSQSVSDCFRARRLCLSVIPMALSSVCGLVSQVVLLREGLSEETRSPLAVLECLPRAVRLGYDSPQKLAFSSINDDFLTRVQYHNEFPSDLINSASVWDTEGYSVVVQRVISRLREKAS